MTRQDTSKDAEGRGFSISNLKDDSNHTLTASGRGMTRSAYDVSAASGTYLDFSKVFYMVSHHCTISA